MLVERAFVRIWKDSFAVDFDKLGISLERSQGVIQLDNLIIEFPENQVWRSVVFYKNRGVERLDQWRADGIAVGAFDMIGCHDAGALFPFEKNQ